MGTEWGQTCGAVPGPPRPLHWNGRDWRIEATVHGLELQTLDERGQWRMTMWLDRDFNALGLGASAVRLP